MKTDDNYIYPETAEELAMFYGWEAMIKLVTGYWRSLKIDHIDLDWGEQVIESGDYRLPLPTISDLKVGDVVKWIDVDSEVNMFDLMVNKETLDELIFGIDEEMAHSVQLLIGRNTWVPVKCN